MAWVSKWFSFDLPDGVTAEGTVEAYADEEHCPDSYDCPGYDGLGDLHADTRGLNELYVYREGEDYGDVPDSLYRLIEDLAYEELDNSCFDELNVKWDYE